MNIDVNFQTPEWVCNIMVGLLNPKIKTVLEPTPGIGNLVRALERAGKTVIAPQGFFKGSGWFEAIVMNPPFSPMKKGYEILYDRMDISNVIIALMPYLTIINSETRNKDIFNFGLKEVIHLPRSVFNGSRVQTCLLSMERGYSGKTEYRRINKDA